MSDKESKIWQPIYQNPNLRHFAFEDFSELSHYFRELSEVKGSGVVMYPHISKYLLSYFPYVYPFYEHPVLFYPEAYLRIKWMGYPYEKWTGALCNLLLDSENYQYLKYIEGFYDRLAGIPLVIIFDEGKVEKNIVEWFKKNWSKNPVPMVAYRSEKESVAQMLKTFFEICDSKNN